MVSIEGFRPLEHQAAGHKGVLTDVDGALFIKPTTQQEVDFYTKIHSDFLKEEENLDTDDFEPTLYDFIPRFMGTLENGVSEQVGDHPQIIDEVNKLNLDPTVSEAGKSDKVYIVLDNSLANFKYPAILDLKIGSILHDESASEEKKARLDKVSQETTSSSLNFRVCGMKIHHDESSDLSTFKKGIEAKQVLKDDHGYFKFDKWWGRALTKDDISETFEIFFKHNKLSKKHQRLLIEHNIMKLKDLINCTKDSNYRFRSSSLFFVFENDIAVWEENDKLLEFNEEDDDDSDDDDGGDSEGSANEIKNNDKPATETAQKKPIAEIKNEDDDEKDDDDAESNEDYVQTSSLQLIDFAHTKLTPGEKDERFQMGLNNILKFLESSLDSLSLD